MGHSAQDKRVLGLSLSSDGRYNEVTNQIDGAQDLTKPVHFLGLPYEVAHHILTFLDFDTLRDGMSLTSRNVRRVCAYLLFRGFKFSALRDREDFERLDQFMNTTSVSVVKRLNLWVSTSRDVPEDKVQESLERLIGIFTKFSHLIELTLFGEGKDLGSFPTMWTSAQCQLETITLSIYDDITRSKWGGFLTSQPKLRHLAIYRARNFEMPPIPSLKSVRVELGCGHIRFPDNMSSTLRALEYLFVGGVDTLSLSDMPSLKQLHCSDVQRLVMDSKFPNLTDVNLHSINNFNFIPPAIPLPSLSKLRMVDVPLHLARGCTTLASVEFLDDTLDWPRQPHDLESLKDSALSLRSLTIREDHGSDSEIPPSYQVIKTFTFLADLTIQFGSILVRLCWSPFDQKCPTSSLFGVVKSLKYLQTLSWEVSVLLVDPAERDPTEDYFDEGIVGWLDDMSDGCARASPSLLHAEFRCDGFVYIHDMLSEEAAKLGWRMRHTRTSIADPFEKWTVKEDILRRY